MHIASQACSSVLNCGMHSRCWPKMCGWFLPCALDATLSVAPLEEVRSRRLGYVGSRLVPKGFTLSAAFDVAPSIASIPDVLSTRTQTGGEREPCEHGTPRPHRMLCTCLLSTHGDSGCMISPFTMVFQCCLRLSSVRTLVSADVQETNAGDFSTLPVDHSPQQRWTFWIPKTGSCVLDHKRCCLDANC